MRSGSSRPLAIVFLAVLVPAAVTLVWLGLRLLEQDRILFQQRDVERQEAAADSVVRSLSAMLEEAERRVSEVAEFTGLALVRRGPAGDAVEPRSLATWIRPAIPLPEIPADPFESAEAQEFQGRSGTALQAYQQMAAAADVRIRAGALLRSARVLRTRGDLNGAAAAYRALAQIQSVALDAMPVDLLARRELCDLRAAAGDKTLLLEDASHLETELTGGRWRLGRDAAELVMANLAAWLGRSMTPGAEMLAAASAAEWFLQSDGASSVDHDVRHTAGTPVTVIARGAAGERRALLVASSALEGWVSRLQQGTDLQITLLDDQGNLLAGAGLTGAAVLVRRSPSSTVPWALALARAPGSPASTEFEARRRLFTAGLAALGLLFAGGSYLLWRVVQRELAVARLQTEFVSAVSHEFRTPVTSPRHVIELLQEDDEVPKERRASFYDVLARSTERLDRLVESLLDFGRMESGRKPYDLQPLDVTTLVTGVAREFESAPAARGYRVDVDLADAPRQTVPGDAASLGHAVWNLLDNAVKYSPGADRVRIAVARRGAHNVAVSVSDEGIGVPRRERAVIFEKFVRGEQAARLGIKGTGVGLAMVSHIVAAHRGTVELQSTEGQGSTFTMVLPIA